MGGGRIKHRFKQRCVIKLNLYKFNRKSENPGSDGMKSHGEIIDG